MKFCVLESKEEARLAVVKTESENAWFEEKKQRTKGGMPWLWTWEFWAGERVFTCMAMDVDESGSSALDRMFVVETQRWVPWVPLVPLVTNEEEEL